MIKTIAYFLYHSDHTLNNRYNISEFTIIIQELSNTQFAHIFKNTI